MLTWVEIFPYNVGTIWVATEEGLLNDMRKLRPEYYSDTEDRVKYILDAPNLEYHLESITSRNQTHDFEIFCRKLCERTICPNLRAHTGPDGGGDSKADTETYPVAEEIAVLFYIGETKAAKERWAFAFSAKEKWSTKVRDDVKGIVETGRDYKRIFFVTSRFTRDKDRARIEDELSKKYKIPVTIHDRSWIVKEIIENDRKDIAYNYLKIGEAKNDPLRLGPYGHRGPRGPDRGAQDAGRPNPPWVAARRPAGEHRARWPPPRTARRRSTSGRSPPCRGGR